MRSLVPAIEVPGLAGGEFLDNGRSRKAHCSFRKSATRSWEDLVRQIIVAIAATFSSRVASPARARPPNYLASRAYQSPAWRNDTLGGTALPQRGLSLARCRQVHSSVGA
jgi:hypothetical protein